MRIEINKDEEVVFNAREALKLNGGYCPCALEKTEATKCICESFLIKIEKGYIGKCNCGLYISIKEV